MSIRFRVMTTLFFVWGAAACEGTVGGEYGEEGARSAAAVRSAGYYPVTPFRPLDTREDDSRLRAASARCLLVAGEGGVADTAKAVAINLVAVNPAGPGYLTAYPGGTTRPETSSLNYAQGQTVANGAIVGVGGDGKICVYSLAATDLVVDVTGYFAAASGFQPAGPLRVVDTRDDDGPPLRSGATPCYKIAGHKISAERRIPDDAKAVAINLTAVRAAGPGYFTAYPSGTNRPKTSTVNYGAGQVVANNGIVQLGEDGSLCVYVKTSTHLVLDVTGYFDAGADYRPVSPFRRIDTRTGSQPVVGSTRCYTVAGYKVDDREVVPRGASAVAVNLAAAEAVGPGFLLARPAGRAEIQTSVLNYAPGGARANGAIVQVGVNGKICIYTRQTAHYILDVVGYWPGDHALQPPAHPHTFKVNSAARLLNALETACCGDTIAVDPSKTIDLTAHKEIAIPGDVTITGGRSGSAKGALIRSTDRTVLPRCKTWHLFRTAGSNVTLRGVRLQGPDGSVGAACDVMGGGIRVRYEKALVSGSELYHWPAAGVSVDADGVVVSHSYIHDNIRYGRGYGVVVGQTTRPIVIEHNTFAQNRHSIAGGGDGSYIVRHNRFLHSGHGGMHSVIDMHGVNEHKLDNSSMQAGVFIHIHNNDFEHRGSLQQPLVGIRGIPADKALIEQNCVGRTDGRWVGQYVMTASPTPIPGYNCYEKAGVQLCHKPAYGADMRNIVVGYNRMGVASGCR